MWGAELDWNEGNVRRLSTSLQAGDLRKDGTLSAAVGLSWPSNNKTREKRVIPALWFPFFWRWQSLRFSDCFHISPMYHHSKYLQDMQQFSVWPVLSGFLLRLRSSIQSLFFSLFFAHYCKVEWHSWIPLNLIYRKMFNKHEFWQNGTSTAL